MFPALQNSGWAKWGSARADRILKLRVSEKNGISFAGICKSPDVNSCPRFLLFPWAAPVGCDLRDLGSPSLQRNLQKRSHRILNMKRNLLSRFSSLNSLPVFPPPQNFSLGIWDLLSARSSIGTSEALGSLAVRGTPCPHGLRLMRCKICCGCEHGRLRGQCKECGGSSSFCEHRRCSATTATARNVAAAASASTGGSAASAKSVAAAASASTGARATTATVECGGSSIASTGGCAPPA